MDVLAIYNPKGGVGKSVTAVNLAAAFGESGRRVLVVDLDPGASATLALGVREDGRALADAITALDSLPARPSTTPLVDLAASGPAMEVAERVLAGEPPAVLVVREKLARVAAGYDVAILDTPPGHGMLPRTALAAARCVLVPTVPSPLALDGLARTMAAIAEVRERLNPDLAQVEVLLTQVTRRAGRLTELKEDIARRFACRVLPCLVHRSRKIDQAAGHGRPILLHSPESAAAREYRLLARACGTLLSRPATAVA